MKYLMFKCQMLFCIPICALFFLQGLYENHFNLRLGFVLAVKPALIVHEKRKLYSINQSFRFTLK